MSGQNIRKRRNGFVRVTSNTAIVGTSGSDSGNGDIYVAVVRSDAAAFRHVYGLREFHESVPTGPLNKGAYVLAVKKDPSPRERQDMQECADLLASGEFSEQDASALFQ